LKTLTDQLAELDHDIDDTVRRSLASTPASTLNPKLSRAGTHIGEST
jgi:hypothetical protein